MSRIAELGAKLFNANQSFRPKILDTEKRVRGRLNGYWIFDTTHAKLVWESYYPQYWVPRDSFLSVCSFREDAPMSGIQSSTSKLTVGDKTIPSLLVPDSFNSELAGYVKLEFDDLDKWYEEQSEILYHPIDPFHRVDVHRSTRTIKVELAGKTLADTSKEGGVMGLWETNIPARWYVPPTAVNWEYLKPSNTKTGCPYKGDASYYDAVIDGKTYKDVVWYYLNPIQESILIKDLLCFYPDKVETTIDGKPLAEISVRPRKNETKEAEKPKSCNC